MNNSLSHSDDFTIITVTSLSMSMDSSSLSSTPAVMITLTSNLSSASLDSTSEESSFTVSHLSTSSLHVSSTPQLTSTSWFASRLPSHRASSSSNTVSSRAYTSPVINVIPSPHPSHSLISATRSKVITSTSTTAHSVYVTLSTNTVSTTPSSLAFQTSLHDQLGSFTFVTINPSDSHSTSSTFSILSPSPPSFTTSLSQPSHSVITSAATKRIGSAILGTIGTLFLVSALGSLIIWLYKRRWNSASVSTISQNDSSIAEEPREVSFQGTRRFRFPQSNAFRQPLTLSPPSKAFYGSRVHFPSDSTSTEHRKTSSPYLLPPSLAQSLSPLSLRPSRHSDSNETSLDSCSPKLISANDLLLNPLVEPIEVTLPVNKEPSAPNVSNLPEHKPLSPPAFAEPRPPVPEIRLEPTDTPIPDTQPESRPQSLIQIPKPVYDTITPASSFLASPPPNYAPTKACKAMTPTLLTPLSPASLSIINLEKKQEPKDLEPGALPAKPSSWASSLRSNLYHAVQYMNSKRVETTDHDHGSNSDLSSLFSQHSSESGRMSVKSAKSNTGTVSSERKRLARRTWVVVNGSTRLGSQSAESLSEAYCF